MAVITIIIVIIFRESRAFKTSSRIIPKLIDLEMKIFLKNILNVLVRAKYKEAKKGITWVTFA